MSEKKLRRSGTDRMVSGTLAGCAEYLGIDASVLRIVFVLVSLFSAAFPGLIIYLILLVLMPPAEPTPGNPDQPT